MVAGKQLQRPFEVGNRLGVAAQVVREDAAPVVARFPQRPRIVAAHLDGGREVSDRRLEQAGVAGVVPLPFRAIPRSA
jgi:(2Fe-2S) ferredoxin